MYDPEDYEYEPSDELAVKIRELVEEEARNKIKDTFDALNYQRSHSNKLSEQLREAHIKLNSYEKDIANARAEGVLEGERKFCCGFTVNDKVWYAKNKCTYAKCETCRGKGEVPVVIFEKESKAKCPNCQNGNVRTDNYVPVEDTVNSLKFWVSAVERGSPHKGNKLMENWDIDVWLKNLDSSLNRRSLYKSLEECQAYCDEKNLPKAIVSTESPSEARP